MVQVKNWTTNVLWHIREFNYGKDITGIKSEMLVIKGFCKRGYNFLWIEMIPVIICQMLIPTLIENLQIYPNAWATGK